MKIERRRPNHHLCDLTTKPQYFKACNLFPHDLVIYSEKTARARDLFHFQDM